MGIYNAFLTSLLVSFFITFPWVMVIAVLWYGNQMHETGQVTAGELIVFLLLSVQAGFCLSNFKPIYSHIMQAMVASNRIFDIILQKEDIEPSLPMKVLNNDKMYSELFTNNASFKKSNFSSRGYQESDDVNKNKNPYNVVKSANKFVSMRKGEIEFQNVRFWYNNKPDEIVFEDVSFKIASGSSIAIVGSEGSGKKTLLNLIQRFYDVRKGSVKIDK